MRAPMPLQRPAEALTMVLRRKEVASTSVLCQNSSVVAIGRCLHASKSASADVAHLVEHLPSQQKVVGSIPTDLKCTGHSRRRPIAG